METVWGDGKKLSHLGVHINTFEELPPHNALNGYHKNVYLQ